MSSKIIPVGFDNITILRGSKYVGLWEWDDCDFEGRTAIIKIKNIHPDFKDKKNVWEVGTAIVEPLDTDGNPYKGRVKIELTKEETFLLSIPEEEEFLYDEEGGYYSVLNIILDDGTVILSANVKVVNSLEVEDMDYLTYDKDNAILIYKKLNVLFDNYNEVIEVRDNLINEVLPNALNEYKENHNNKLQELIQIVSNTTSELTNYVKEEIQKFVIIENNIDDVKTLSLNISNLLELKEKLLQATKAVETIENIQEIENSLNESLQASQEMRTQLETTSQEMRTQLETTSQEMRTQLETTSQEMRTQLEEMSNTITSGDNQISEIFKQIFLTVDEITLTDGTVVPNFLKEQNNELETIKNELDKKSNNLHTHTLKDLGLENVDNTKDEDKPISLAVKKELDKKMDINSEIMFVNNYFDVPTSTTFEVKKALIVGFPFPIKQFNKKD
ncbi:hypothetical protein ACOL28_03660 [Aliarcobacter butzleri]